MRGRNGACETHAGRESGALHPGAEGLGLTTSDPVGKRSRALFERARVRIPGGVNSPVRAFRAVGGEPLFIARGEGPYIWDADGRRYIDYVGS